MKKNAPQTKTADFRFQLKAVSDDGTFEGYGAVFNNVDFGGDVIAPGAFAETLKELTASGRKLPMLWQHDTTVVIGTFDEITEDEKGLYVKGRLLQTVQKGKEAYELLKAGAISGLSIGYGTDKYEVDTETYIRTLKEVTLYEISLVTFPMNDEARIDAVKQRIAEGGLPETIADFEKFLRDAGFSRKNATEIASRGIKGLLRDAESNEKADTLLGMLQNFTIKT